MKTRQNLPLWGLPALAVALLAAGCTGDPDVDMDELGGQLDEDGRALIEEFETNNPSGGEVTSTSPGADGSTDEECDGGVLRRWDHEFSFTWPGDPTNESHVDTSFDSTLDFLSAAFNRIGYSAQWQEFGDGSDPRWVEYVRTATDDEIELEFRVDYELAPSQADDDTIVADFTVTGTTTCVGSDS
jgi:hypothetical protein